MRLALVVKAVNGIVDDAVVCRADLLRASVRTPKVGDRFYFSAGAVANGAAVAIDLCLDD